MLRLAQPGRRKECRGVPTQLMRQVTTSPLYIHFHSYLHTGFHVLKLRADSCDTEKLFVSLVFKLFYL